LHGCQEKKTGQKAKTFIIELVQKLMQEELNLSPTKKKKVFRLDIGAT
jgi:hypothetical protein